ncbi:MAG: hypothetical protein MjAS7_2659 [Metallosphaera javensis (ex Sakai et al. 2022)]|nr:MAG: hypothetical protein MjAS7_2659 [Metallosphaera javensis (ex Sakai et al. 2022)]
MAILLGLGVNNVFFRTRVARVMINIADVLATVGLIGVAHGLEPDHISSARLVRKNRKLVEMAIFHSAGFALIAIPLSLVLIYFSYVKPEIELASDLLGIVFGGLLLISGIFRLEFEVEPKSTGLIQGMFNVTPSKIVTIILAMNTGSILLGAGVITWFAIVTSLSIILVGMATLRLPRNLDRVLDVATGTITILFFILLLNERFVNIM